MSTQKPRLPAKKAAKKKIQTKQVLLRIPDEIAKLGLNPPSDALLTFAKINGIDPKVYLPDYALTKDKEDRVCICRITKKKKVFGPMISEVPQSVLKYIYKLKADEGNQKDGIKP